MPQPLSLAVAIGLPPARAVEYFKSKGYAITESWDELWQDAHARAFTVAGAMKLDILQDIRGELDKALAGGHTPQSFIKELQPRLAAKGWWGKQVQVRDEGDGTIGEARLAQTGSPWRLKTILRTNQQSAYMGGRWAQMIQNVKARPYWQYVAVMDARTRPAHAALNGLVFRYDDPFWQHFYPPCGFNCRCTVRALAERDLVARGLSVSASGDHLRERWVQDPSSGVMGQVATYKTPAMEKAGRTDLGFNYNPGQAAWQPDLDAYDYDLGRAYVDALRDSSTFDRFVGEQSEAGTLPLAVLKPEDRKLLGAESQQVLLSTDTLAKQKKNHTDIGADDYRLVQAIIDRGELYKQGDERLVFMAVAGVWYRAVVKVTRDGRELFLVSLFRTGERAVRQVRGKLERLR